MPGHDVMLTVASLAVTISMPQSWQRSATAEQQPDMARPPADEPEIERLCRRVRKQSGFEVPETLLDMLRNGEDGITSGVAPGFRLWSIDELTQGKDHAIEIDGFFMFASDDAGSTWGLNMGTGEVLLFAPTAVFTSVAPSLADFRAKLD